MMEKWSWLMLNIGKEEGASQGKGRRQKKSINKEEVRNRKYMDRNLKKKKKSERRKEPFSVNRAKK